MRDMQSELRKLPYIRAAVKKYGAQIGVPDAKIFGAPRGDGSPYVEISDAYYFIVEERGIELSRQKTNDLDELLYWIFNIITFSVASDFEVKNRKRGEDSRRQLFAKQEVLMGEISTPWRERKLAEHEFLLAAHPFNDDLG